MLWSKKHNRSESQKFEEFMDDFRTELKELDERELSYVIARSKFNSENKALKDCGISSSTFYGWEESKREHLNNLALKFKQDAAIRAIMKLQDHAEEAVDVITSLMTKSRNDNVKLKAAQDVADRTIGKPTQKTEVTGEGGGALVINLSWDDDEPE